jgi:hypothetical protein
MELQKRDAMDLWAPIAEDVFSPAAAPRCERRLALIARGPQGELLYREREGETWSDFRSLGVPMGRTGPSAAAIPVDWPIAACATGDDQIQLLARSPEGELLHGVLRADIWEGFECIGAPEAPGIEVAVPMGLAGAPSACSRARGQMDVFAVGASGALLHTTWNGSEFSELQSLRGIPWRGGRELPISGAISAAACGSRSMGVFARGSHGELLVKWWDGVSWSPFASVTAPDETDPINELIEIPMPLASAPAACGGGAGRLDVFARSPGGDLLHRWWNGSSWTRFESLGMPRSGSAPIPFTGISLACTWGKWRLDVFARGVDGRLYAASSNGSWVSRSAP